MLRVKARAYARPLRGFGLDPSAFPVFVACHHVGGDRRRSAQKSELPHGLTRNAPYKVHPFASNPDHHLVEVPSIARAWAAPPQLSCDPGPEFQHPAPHRLIGNLQAALGEKFLNVAVAQGEPEIKPDRVLDDRRREAMPSVGELIHAGSLPHGLAHLETPFP